MQPVLVHRGQFVPQGLVEIFDNGCISVHFALLLMLLAAASVSNEPIL
jgi:hypothetical protein